MVVSMPSNMEGGYFSCASSVSCDDDDHHYDGCFEGSEKKMEIDFIPMDGSDVEALPKDGGLRTYDRKYWSDIIALLNGSILLHTPEKNFDAYLISESSLFVYNDRIIILTCGTTLLLKTLPAFIEAASKIGLEVSWFQYSRKNFLFPDKQHSPHKTFDMEVDFLQNIFPSGRPFVMGPMTADHWYLFVADFIDRGVSEGEGEWGWERRGQKRGRIGGGRGPGEGDKNSNGSGDKDEKEGRKVMDKDQMLNVYMYGIDPHVAQLFVKGDSVILPSIFTTFNTSGSSSSLSSSSTSTSGTASPMYANSNDAVLVKKGQDTEALLRNCEWDSSASKATKEWDVNAAAFEGFDFCSSPEEATRRSGIEGLLAGDGSVSHAHLFEPCGYSMNGQANRGQAYWTIHITPEASCSYASFETNYNCESYHELIERIIKVFRPAKFTTVEHVDVDSMIGTAGPVTPATVDGYRAAGRTLTEFGCKDYVVQVCNYQSRTVKYVAPVPPVVSLGADKPNLLKGGGKEGEGAGTVKEQRLSVGSARRTPRSSLSSLPEELRELKQTVGELGALNLEIGSGSAAR
jgi:S-adenosylmethionine decarboxylase